MEVHATRHAGQTTAAVAARGSGTDPAGTHRRVRRRPDRSGTTGRCAARDVRPVQEGGNLDRFSGDIGQSAHLAVYTTVSDGHSWPCTLSTKPLCPHHSEPKGKKIESPDMGAIFLP